MLHNRILRFASVLVLLAIFLVPASSAGASPAGMPPLATFFGCTGNYYNNTTVDGSAVMTRYDGQVNFFWPENTSPGSGVAINNYSVRWTCSVNFPNSDNYTFTATTDDGMNIFVDGNLILWAFYDQGPTTYYPVTYINAGVHTVTVEYYNRWNAGTARVSFQEGAYYATPYSPYTTTGVSWTGQYYNNQTLSGSPTLTRTDSSINFNWGTGSPDSSIPSTHFSVRWAASPYLAAGTWRFVVGSDDGIRVWVDSTLLVDRWYNQSYSTNNYDITLGAGNHSLRVEYYQDIVNAQVSVNFYQLSGTSYSPPALYTPTPVSVSPPAYAPPPAYFPPGLIAPGQSASSTTTTGIWHGRYYSNIWLNGSPSLQRDDAALNFNWGEGSPGPSVPGKFSAKWDSIQNAPTSDYYTVAVSSDDGSRVWIDGQLIIDDWYDHLPMMFTATRYLTAGSHNVHVEYYNSSYGGMLNLQIRNSLFPNPPPLPFYGNIVVDDAGQGWQTTGSSSDLHASTTGINNHSFWAFSRASAASTFATGQWYPTLPAPGKYEVYAYIPAGNSTTTNAIYTITHAGTTDVAIRSQAGFQNQWTTLGTYYFAGGGGEYVSLTDVTGECIQCRKVVFDAIQFSPR